MSKHTWRPILPVLFLVASLAPRPALAQLPVDAFDGRVEDGAFEARFPEAYALLVASQATQARILEALASDLRGAARNLPMPAPPGGHGGHEMMMTDEPMVPKPPQATAELFQRYSEALRSAEPVEIGPPEIQAGNGLTERLSRIVQRTHELQRTVLDIYAEESITDKAQEVDLALSAYQSDPEHALPSDPKSMDLVMNASYARTVRLNFPYLEGLVWSSSWFEYAAFEPFFLRDTPEERDAAMETIKLRFRSKLSSPPENFPSEMPMVPTIAPGLRLMHPDVAAVLDNMDMMLAAIADLMVDPRVDDKSAAVAEVVDVFTEPDYRIASWYDWSLMALRHGIFNQGGPALGSLDQSERNQAPHLMVGGMPN